MGALSRDEIVALLHALDRELRKDGVRGQAQIAGGAVMCLAFNARSSTREVDAVFEPSSAVLDAALRVAARTGVPDTWLNNAVRGYLSDTGTFERFLELDNLRVFVADARYMLAMKCLAMRVGEGYHDEEDVRFPLRHLAVNSFDETAEILSAYYPIGSFPARSMGALKEILAH